jgi:hypothetical protein
MYVGPPPHKGGHSRERDAWIVAWPKAVATNVAVASPPRPVTAREMDDLVGPARGHDPGVTRRAAGQGDGDRGAQSHK